MTDMWLNENEKFSSPNLFGVGKKKVLRLAQVINFCPGYLIVGTPSALAVFVLFFVKEVSGVGFCDFCHFRFGHLIFFFFCVPKFGGKCVAN